MIDSFCSLRDYIQKQGEPDTIEISSTEWDRLWEMLRDVEWFDPELKKVVMLNCRYVDPMESREHFKFAGTKVCRTL